MDVDAKELWTGSRVPSSGPDSLLHALTSFSLRLEYNSFLFLLYMTVGRSDAANTWAMPLERKVFRVMDFVSERYNFAFAQFA